MKTVSYAAHQLTGFRNHRQSCSLGWAGLLAATLFLSPSLPASNLIWTNTASSGNYTNPNNWNPILTPGAQPVDATIFTNDTSYTVSFTASSILATNYFNGHAGAVTLDITGASTWTLTNNANGLSGSALGALVIGQALNTTATVYLAGGTLAATNSAAANLLVGGQGQGTFFVTNGTVIAMQTKVGSTASGRGTLVLSGSGVYYTNSSTFNIGSASGTTGNSLVISDSASMTIASALTVGSTGSGGNSLLITNALLTSVAATLGTASSNNTATVLGGGTWNLGSTILTIGSGTATGNLVYIDGGTVTNVTRVDFAGTQPDAGNSLVVTNGGSLFTSSAIVIGGTPTTGRSNNLVLVVGGGGSATSRWHLGNGSTLTVGSGQATGNVLRVDGNGVNGGAVVSGINGVNMGSTTASGASLNSFIIANGGLILASNNVIIGNGSSNNLFVVMGGTATSEWRNAGVGQGFTIGTAASTGNVMRVDGGGLDGGAVVSNITLLTVGSVGNAFGNRLVVTNGGRLFSSGTLNIGANAAASNNTVIIDGGSMASPTSTIVSNAGVFVGGSSPVTSGGAFNTLTVTNAALLTSGASVIGRGSSNNTVTIAGSGTWNLFNTSLTLGAAGNAIGNTLLVNGGQVLASAVIAGSTAGGSNNSVLVSVGGLIEANTLSNFVGGSGNTISNVGGTYQFTSATPAIVPNGFGNIALTAGTISFRAITNADVYANWSGTGHTLTNMAFAGNNTFRLNAATNRLEGLSQTYTFDTGLGATNFTRLEMVNGQTAYRNGNITVGSGGSMLLSNTRATVSGVLSNNGVFTSINSVATFKSAVINSGAWITDPTTNIFEDTYSVTSSGYIQMSAGDVYVFSNGATSASFLNRSTQSNVYDTIDGKFVFNSSLTTTQSFLAAGSNIGNLDTDGGTNVVTVPTLDINQLPQYTNNYALGTLRIDSFFDVFTELTLDQGGLFLTNLELGATAQLVISNDVQVYFITSNNFNFGQVTLLGNGGLHQLVLDAVVAVVPEPSVLLLLATGAVAVGAYRRRHNRPA